MKHKWMMGLCVVCAAALAMPAAAAPGPAQFAQSENCLAGLWEALQGSGFVTAEDGQVRYRSGWGDCQRFEPGFVTVEGQLYHVEADGVTFTRLPLGLSVVDGSVCYSSDGLSIQTFAPGFVTLDEQQGVSCLYVSVADGEDTDRYWVDVNTRLLCRADTLSGGGQIYQLRQTGCQTLTPEDTALQGIFQLPDGTAVSAATGE